MNNLYDFLEEQYNNCSHRFKNEIGYDFNRFIEGFMAGSFYADGDSIREAYWFDEDFLCNFCIDYEVDHSKRDIKLLFSKKNKPNRKRLDYG